MPSATAPATAWLVPLSGPALSPMELPAKPGGVTLGRHEACDVRLPADADKVSRQHARLSFDAGTWRLADLRSRWGTYLNGVKVEPGPEMPLSEGDFIRITPWTFSFSTKGPTRRGLRAADDQMQTMVRAVAPDAAQPLAEDLLTLLLESAAAVHSAGDEKTLGEIVLDSAVRGTGMPNAALLRPLDAAGTVEVIASRRDKADEGSAIYSRSLLATASTGVVAELSGQRDEVNVSSSIVQMKIDTALCVPLMLGQTVAAYLYLDSRSQSGRVGFRRLRPNAAAFCTALGRMASLALSNLKRIDIERRQAKMESELSAAAAAQRWILPKRETALCGFAITGESRPGAYVGGDFFDVIVLSDTKLAVALGDVTGHGIAASVLMTAAQGFLHAALQEHAEPARAVNDLNQFIHPRRSDEKFVTLWVGVFDCENKSLSYVDAGHGYAMMVSPTSGFAMLDQGEGLPIGLFADADYKSITKPLEPGGRALVISDGIVEQYGLVTAPSGTTSNEHFHVAGVQRVISATPPDRDPVTALFDAVVKHAGTTSFQDDATAVLVKW